MSTVAGFNTVDRIVFVVDELGAVFAHAPVAAGVGYVDVLSDLGFTPTGRWQTDGPVWTVAVTKAPIRREHVTGSVCWTPLAEATHAMKMDDNLWHPADATDAAMFARHNGDRNVREIATVRVIPVTLGEYMRDERPAEYAPVHAEYATCSPRPLPRREGVAFAIAQRVGARA